MLTVPEIAAELRISETSVYRLINADLLPSVKAGVRRKVVSREALDTWIRQGGVDGPTSAGAGAPSDQPAPTPARAS